MKRLFPLIIVTIILSCMSGYLLSKASFAGRTGINLFYKQYKFLKTWWQGALLVFAVLFILLLMQHFIRKKWAGMAQFVHFLLLLIAITGLYFTYLDFKTTLTHRLLGDKFHMGAYLFWIGWIIISLTFLFQRKSINKEL